MRANDNPYWIAPRGGQEWRDEDVLRATAWLKSFVPSSDMERRLEATRDTLLAARARWADGETVPLFDPADTAAWYILQGETFAVDRRLWVPDAMVRIVPFLTRLGKELDELRTVTGAEARAARLMTAECRQPDGGIFELLVALAYKRRGWSAVQFVPEQRGVRRTPDLHVYRPRSRWAVECKRLMPSTYAQREKELGTNLAKTIHELSSKNGRSLLVELCFKIELCHVSDDYLACMVREALKRSSDTSWNDEIAKGYVRDIDWRFARHVLKNDDVYFGSSRMIELLVGYYTHEADHSLTARWRPSPERPFYAESVYQASVVSWVSLSAQSMAKKARHFRSVLGNAESQLPDDRPGVIHVGMESTSGSTVDAMRHVRNFVQARTFAPSTSRLRWVYGSYFVPELTTRRNETWALTETTAPYKIGSHRTSEPLPGHMLVSPEGEGRPGVHWDGS
jgi:hypothetical protein